MANLIGYGTYIPYWRLDRKAIGAALGTPAGKGTRAVASYDEDSTSMAVEAGRQALRGGTTPAHIYFATASPSYLDKTNATTVHAALGLGPDGFAADMAGSVRSGIGAIRAALDASEPTLVALSDVRTGLPGGTDESAGGDGAAALLFGEGPAIAEYVGGASTSDEFLDRWRVPGSPSSRVWEERFGEFAYAPLVQQAVQMAYKSAGIDAAAPDRVIVAGLHARAVRSALKAVRPREGALQDDLTSVIGNTGTAHPAILLAAALDQAGPGELVALVVLADGCDVLLFRTTDALRQSRQPRSVAAQIEAGNPTLPYAQFLTWRGLLTREPPRRPDPEAPAAPPAFRREGWKFAFACSRCEACGTRHLPPQRVCVKCHAVDQMAAERLADVQATVATFTVDRLAFSLSPPVVVGVLDFDGGGRFQCELTDVDPSAVRIGDRVEMTFRRLYEAGGVQNYFWKARPIRGHGG